MKGAEPQRAMSEAGHSPEIAIEKLPLGIYQANCYIITCPPSPDAVVVDAPGDAGSILSRLEGRQVRCIVLTHAHRDHVEALPELRELLGAPVAMNEADVARVGTAPERLLRDGDVIEVGGCRLSVIHTPGHTAGSICLYSGSHLISGDTLFPGGPGKTARPADFQQILASITTRLFPLPDDTLVHPGHGPDAVLGNEKPEFAAFSRREHRADLCGDVLWATS